MYLAFHACRCVVCGEWFIGGSPSAKYCYKPCERKHAYRECVCGEAFIPKEFDVTRCSDTCVENYRSIESDPPRNIQVLVSRKGILVPLNMVRLSGWYVYSWTFTGDTLPFYIGKGTDGRAWQVHSKQTCQRELNNTSKSLKVTIHRDNLTSKGALFLESCLIEVFTNLGAMLTNQKSESRKEPKLPWEMS